ncbi:hypothetical protein BGY98DRAFT_509051 [Russula aff. rugulosa BPL654]|nr:hypothetical protein BGY98DRAFT_509051 [Russula aff. rugulosa BPL654]
MSLRTSPSKISSGPCIDPVSRVMSLRKDNNSDMFSLYSTLARLDILNQSRFYRYDSIWARLGRPFPTSYIVKDTANLGLSCPVSLWPGAYVIVFPSDFERHFLNKSKKNGQNSQNRPEPEDLASIYTRLVRFSGIFRAFGLLKSVKSRKIPKRISQLTELGSHDTVVSRTPPCRTVISPSI